ncbi:hypothetical protein B0H17DRAFT_943971 [Mycena rosella]|uniref:RNase H type-1 domain-containing protein n=1 Tax=Mycena rosella TaxID=1033263 RepID=A0AAD7G8Z7_MYCRO|nr:hypothetical protein B0H17DRAFT_943971 [Mycena rosella]
MFAKIPGNTLPPLAQQLYFGPNSRLNQSVRVWGNQNNVRADLVALLLAVQTASRTKSLIVSTRSDYAIRFIKYYSYMNDACGWKCANGDIPKAIISRIQYRTAPIPFIHFKKR